MILYKDRKHILRYIAIIFIAAVLILWIVCVVDVNRRFPKAEEELYSVGEWIEESGFEIKVNSLELISLEEASEKYGVNLQNDMKKIVPSTKYFILKMDVRNISDEELNIGKKLMSHTDLQVMPIGIVEVGEVLTNYTENIKLQPGEEDDDFYCYYVGSRKNTDNEASWQKFYGTDSGLSSPESGNSAILDSLIVDIYRNNEYRKLARLLSLFCIIA